MARRFAIAALTNSSIPRRAGIRTFRSAGEVSGSSSDRYFAGNFRGVDLCGQEAAGQRGIENYRQEGATDDRDGLRGSALASSQVVRTPFPLITKSPPGEAGGRSAIAEATSRRKK